MKTISSLLVFLFVFSICGMSQQREGFYDARKRESDIAHARYYYIVQYNDSLWQQQVYYVPEKKLYLFGTFLDSSCKKPQGRFYYKYPSGQLENTGDYVNGKKHGVWIGFHPNGAMRDSSFWKNGKKVGTSLSWHENGFIMDSSIYNEDESGLTVTWFDNGSAASAGQYAAGRKMTGKWKYFHYNGKLSSLEIYEKGKMVSRDYFDQQGLPIADTFNLDRKAFFASKENFSDFLYRYLSPTVPVYRKAPPGLYIVTIRFVVDTDGKVCAMYPLSKEGYGMEEEAMRVIKRSTWVPAIEHGRKVKAYFTQPVSFFVRG